ncbi:ChbG/HpnK family deacetylase [Cohaesibacter intestini]|uniref:ChbG/HpnK family deacetylase n=1 Tax=Cohaesibacter intestini TaxID=2211145 RepID=UPI000DE92A17|nr:ChbG/HpnK family deacetylase [Cohaesibacter intestini]
MLCVLDYAMTDGINKAVLQLVRHQVLGAVACLPVSDLWPQSARLLREEVVENPALSTVIGMHLSLTGAFSPLSSGFAPANRLSEGSLPRRQDLIAAARFGGLDARILEGEFRTQIKRFIAHMGRSPAFILLEEAIIMFAPAVLGATASLGHFNLGSIAMVVPTLSRPGGLRERMARRFVWHSDLHQAQSWNRRMLVEVKQFKRLPQKSSWRQDTQIWYAVRPSLDEERDRARLERFDNDPGRRFDQMDWFNT